VQELNKMGSLMSSMGSMGGGSGGSSGGGGGMGFPGMPQQNGTEQDMPSQNIMGMQVPDFMGGLYRGAETNNANATKQSNNDTSGALKPSSTIGTPNNVSNPYDMPNVDSMAGGGSSTLGASNGGINTSALNANAQASNPDELSLFNQGPSASNNYGASLTGKLNQPYQLGNNPLDMSDNILGM
jgi:hypothetical protein